MASCTSIANLYASSPQNTAFSTLHTRTFHAPCRNAPSVYPALKPFFSSSSSSSSSSFCVSYALPSSPVGSMESLAYATQTPPAPQKAAEADVMGLLLRQRIVFLGYSLDDFVADAIISQLLLLDAQDPKSDIRLFINSAGGSVSAAMGVFDAIHLCRAPVSTIAFGFAASTAAIILAAGTKGKRFAMPNARIMLHQPMGGASGQAIDVEIQAKEIMYHKTNITHLFSQITGRTYEEVEKDIEQDRYMSPLEAVEYGILDGVIDKDSIIPLVPVPEKVLRRPDYKDAEKDPLKFLTPVIPDDEIF